MFYQDTKLHDSCGVCTASIPQPPQHQTLTLTFLLILSLKPCPSTLMGFHPSCSLASPMPTPVSSPPNHPLYPNYQV